jgi:polyisoprenoid-binding protein YceI
MTSSSRTNIDLSTFADSWVLDPDRTSVVFHTKAVWVLPVKGTAKAIEGAGSVGVDGSLSGTLVVDAASIDTRNKRRDEHLRTADFLEVAKYPTITFEATGVRLTSSGQVEVTGNLTVHGQTRPLTVLAEVSATGGSATVAAEVAIDRSVWGVSSAPFGARLKNRVVINAGFNRV